MTHHFNVLLNNWIDIIDCNELHSVTFVCAFECLSTISVSYWQIVIYDIFSAKSISNLIKSSWKPFQVNLNEEHIQSCHMAAAKVFLVW